MMFLFNCYSCTAWHGKTLEDHTEATYLIMFVSNLINWFQCYWFLLHFSENAPFCCPFHHTINMAWREAIHTGIDVFRFIVQTRRLTDGPRLWYIRLRVLSVYDLISRAIFSFSIPLFTMSIKYCSGMPSSNLFNLFSLWKK